VIPHTCGTTLPADVGTYVRHLASCPETHDEIGAWCRAIVLAVDHEASRETPTETRKTRDLTPAEMADMHRDGEGDSLRDIAAVAGVAPETVRRRIAKHKRSES
jgi:hypothetical protein